MATLFKTFVFLDLEGTGLQDTCPKITELCLVAVHRYALENPVRDEFGTLQPPRILDKLCLCIDPVKSLTEHASKITGLSNTTLVDNEKPVFDPCVVRLIEDFLERQAQPICLVAHGGERYDFPLLKAELQSQKGDLNRSIYCLDSWRAVKGLDEYRNIVPHIIKGYYTLEGIYERFYGELPNNSHSAEGDVQTLMMVFLYKASDLLQWSRSQSKRWDMILPMSRELQG